MPEWQEWLGNERRGALVGPAIYVHKTTWERSLTSRTHYHDYIREQIFFMSLRCHTIYTDRWLVMTISVIRCTRMIAVRE